jgi:ribonuclease P protein component
MICSQVPQSGTAPAVTRNRTSRQTSRLRRRAEFQYLKDRGHSAVGRYCVVRAADPLDGQPRVAFVISRHYDRSAVRRNRARRLFREAYRACRPALRPAWMVFRPRAAMHGITLPLLLDDVGRLLRKLDLMHPADAAGTTHDEPS